MPVYIQLLTWTDQGRMNADSVAQRLEDVSKRAEQELGVRIIAAYVTMGRFDQIIVCEAPNDEAVAKVAMMVAGRGNAVTESCRAFTMDEVRNLT
jgi:uncharacterized protein with GYD domain